MPYKDPEKRKEMLNRIRPTKGRVSITRNSASHVALLYMKMVNRPIQPFELRELNPKKFNKHTVDTLKRLTNSGYAARDGETYTITHSGVMALYEITQRRPSRQSAD